MTASRDAIASIVWAEIAASGVTQNTVAKLAGITPKHMSQMVNGKSGSLDMVDRVLSVLGRRLVVATAVATEVGEQP